MRHTDELSAKVEAVNMANREANRLYPILRAIFEPLVGQRITKKDCTLLARIAKLVPDFPNTHNLKVYGKGSEHIYSLSFTVKTCINYGDHMCTYHEVQVCICDLNNGVITRFYDNDQNRPTNYTVEDINAKREAARVAKKAYEVARSACYPFEER